MMGFTILLALMVVKASTEEIMVRENVLFQKVNHISLSKANWLVTFIIDLSHLDTVIEKLYHDIDYAHRLTDLVNDECKLHPQLHLLCDDLQFFSLGIRHLNETLDDITKRYQEHRHLKNRSKSQRKKRGLINFVGSALNFLFGTATDEQFNKVRQHVAQLQNNQQTIKHVLKESLTLINITQIQVYKNKQNIMRVLEHIYDLGQTVNNTIAYAYRNRVMLSYYIKLELMMGELKSFVNRLGDYLHHLELQFSVLALKKLTPAIISPNDLFSLLQDIAQNIPPELKLPANPTTDLWAYYQQLNSIAGLDGDHIYVFTTITLLHRTNEMEVYKVFNLPVPLSLNKSEIVAQYSLESPGIAINPERTQFTLMTKDELNICSNSFTPYCEVRSPIYPVNMNTFCISSLFLQNVAKLPIYCQKHILMNTTLPRADYIARGTWAIATNVKFKFNVMCDHKNHFEVNIREPLSVLHLNESCTANSDLLSLPAFYQATSYYHETNSFLSATYPARLDDLTELLIWRENIIPVKKTFNLNKLYLDNDFLTNPNFIASTVDTLIDSLDTATDVVVSEHAYVPWYLYFLIVVALLIALASVGIQIYIMKVGLRRPHGAKTTTDLSTHESSMEMSDMTQKTEPGMQVEESTSANAARGECLTTPVSKSSPF